MLPILIFPVVIGVISGLTFRNKRSFQFYILLSTFVLTFFITSNHYYFNYYHNADFLVTSKEQIHKFVDETKVITKEDREELTKNIDDFLSIFKDFIPFAYFVNSFLLSIFGFFITKFVFIRYIIKDDERIKGIETFTLNDYLIFPLIACWMIVLFVDKNLDYLLYMVTFNIALILSFLYLLQSIGIIKFFLKKKGIPVFLLGVAFMLIMILGLEFLLFFAILLTGFGILDLWIDFRKLKENAEDGGNQL